MRSFRPVLSTVYLGTEFLQSSSHSATVRSTHAEDMEDFTKAVSVKVRRTKLTALARSKGCIRVGRRLLP